MVNKNLNILLQLLNKANLAGVFNLEESQIIVQSLKNIEDELSKKGVEKIPAEKN